MSTQTKTEPKSQKNNGAQASIVWFEIPVDNVERARTFYGKLLGWKIDAFPSRHKNPTGLLILAATTPREILFEYFSCVGN